MKTGGTTVWRLQRWDHRTFGLIFGKLSMVFSFISFCERRREDQWEPREIETELGHQPSAISSWVLVSTVGSLLSSLSFTPTKRYEEVDGVRKEKERLTTDHQPPTVLQTRESILLSQAWSGLSSGLLWSSFFLNEKLELQERRLRRRRPTTRWKKCFLTVGRLFLCLESLETTKG